MDTRRRTNDPRGSGTLTLDVELPRGWADDEDALDSMIARFTAMESARALAKYPVEQVVVRFLDGDELVTTRRVRRPT